MRAVILVGGFGTRLRPLTLTTPKQMLPVVGLPMIERKIAHLVSYGVHDIVLSMGYRPDGFAKAYPDNTCAGATLHYVIEPEPLGTAGAVAFAAREAGIRETFLALNGDTLTDMDVQALIDLHKTRGAEGTLALTPVEDPSRFGVVPTHDDGRVVAFIEKPAKDEAPTNLINAGAYVLEPSFIDRVTPGVEVSIEREIFPQMVSEGRLYAGHFGHYWIDIGTPEAYLQANLDALDSDFDSGSFIGQDARVADSAQVDRSAVGAGCDVAGSALIVESVLLAGVTVEAGATVERSIVAEGATISADATLRDLSVVGAGVVIPPGAEIVAEKVNPSEH